MSPLRAISLFAAMMITPLAARAADLLPPPPMVDAPLRGAIIADPGDPGGWYIRGDVGVAINTASYSSTFDKLTNTAGGTLNVTTLTNAQNSIGDTAFIRAGVGYQFNNWFRADLTAEYQTSAAYHRVIQYPGAGLPGTSTCTAGMTCSDFYSGSVAAAAFLANGYLDMGTWNGLTPYVGAGVGFARLSMMGLTDVGVGIGSATDTSKTNLAWALMTGVAYNINSRLKLEMGYRYLNMGELVSNPIVCTDQTQCFFERQHIKLASHDFHLGMRWLFADSMGASTLVSSSAVLPSSGYASGGCCASSGAVATGAYTTGGQVVGSSRVVSGGGASGGYIASRGY